MERRLKLLAVDVGNTSTAVCLWRNGRTLAVAHCDGGFAEASAAALSIVEKFSPEALAYASVVPSADAGWRAFARRASLQIRTVTWERAERGGGVKFGVPDPASIGADRLADAAGAVSRYGAGVIVMDFGTALTAAAITRDGVWRGGAIAPGLPLMGDYLHERTAKLPKLRFTGAGVPGIGRDTAGAMRFGAVAGFRGMVREIAAEMSRILGEKFKIVATGGFAAAVLRGSGIDAAIDRNLTLYGIGLSCAD